MEKLILLEKLEVNNLLNTRDGEIKFGEQIKLLSNVSNIYDAIKSLDVDYVIFGLPEDVGVFANLGNTGTYNAWNATIKVLLNIQSNPFTVANRVLILGHLDFTEELEQLSKLKQNDKKHIQNARKLVTEIDKHVTDLVCTIISAGKTPIAIGGGHNNAYGMIKGTSLGLKKPINAVNFDAHTDFRNLEGRHSGNGFSYAYNEGFLKKYFIFCLHENYTSTPIFENLDTDKKLDYITYEDIEVRQKTSFKNGLKRGKDHICKNEFGIEIDCDAIINIPSSAKTPSGFSVKKTRQFLHYFAKRKHVKYLHICEAAPTKKTANQVGKLITYLITDFIKAKNTKNE